MNNGSDERIMCVVWYLGRGDKRNGRPGGAKYNYRIAFKKKQWNSKLFPIFLIDDKYLTVFNCHIHIEV